MPCSLLAVNPSPEGPSHSWSDTSGWRFRRVPLNGVPRSAEKGQARSETDEDSEESYVDSLSRHLRHDTSEVYIPMAGGDVVLGTKRSIRGEIWNNGPYGQKANDLIRLRPFGLGWSSGITPHFRFEENQGSGKINYIFVTDENGSTFRFALTYMLDDEDEEDGIVRRVYLPLPTNRTDQDTFLMRFEQKVQVNGNKATVLGYEFKRKFGTTLYFDASPVFTEHIQVSENDSRIDTYFRLRQSEPSIEDRVGNTLTYTYSGGRTLIPSTITGRAGASAPRVIQIVNNGHQITSITDPRGNTWQYEYDDTRYGRYTLPLLSAVKTPENTRIEYGYETPAGQVQVTPDPADTEYAYFHINLNKITSNISDTDQVASPNDVAIPWVKAQKKKVFEIEYEPDTAVLTFSQLGNYLPTASSQRVVRWVRANQHSPEQNDRYVTAFETIHNVAVSVSEGGGPQGERKVKVTDAEGHVRIFHHTHPVNENLRDPALNEDKQPTRTTTVIDTEEIEELISPDGSGSSERAYTILWERCILTHPTNVQEIVTFNPDAGLADLKVIDYSGNITTYEYADRFLFQWTLPSNLQARFAFLDDNVLFSPFYKDPTKEITTSGTDGTKSITKEYGYYSSGSQVAALHLDAASRIMTSSTDALDRKTVYEVQSGTGLRLSVENQDPLGEVFRREEYTYGDAAIPSFMTKSVVKNAIHNNGVFSDTETLNKADAYGNNAQTQVKVAPDSYLTTSCTYDLNGNKLTATDARGYVTSFTYDKLNRVTEVELPDAGAGTATNSIGYNPNGRKLWEKDANGNLSFTKYDLMDRPVASIRVMEDPASVVYPADDGINLVSSVQYNRLSSPVVSTDPRGIETHTAYDVLQRPTLVTVDPTGLNHVSTLTYGANSGGTAFNTSGFKPTSSIDPRGYETIVEFDYLYRPVSSRREYQFADNTTPALYARSETDYDAVGNTVEVRAYRTKGGSHSVTTTDYDALNRPTSVTARDDSNTLAATTTTTYTSTTAYKATDPLGRCTETDYDLAGRAVKVWSPDPVTGLVNRTTTDVAAGSPVTQTVYDANSNVIATINPLGRQWDTTFDARNRKIKEEHPEVADATNPEEPVNGRPTVTMEYDQVGNVVETTDARGTTSEPEYDRAYRVVKATTAKGTAVETVTESIYDKNGNVLSVTDPNGNFTRNTYDALNRLVTTATNPVTGDPSADPSSQLAADITVTNLYDRANNLIQVTDGKGQNTAFNYDGMNRKLTTVWDPGTAVERIEQSTFDGLLQTRRTDPKGQVVIYTYDALYRAKNVFYLGRTRDNRSMAYDLVGNLLSVTYPNETAENKIIRGCSQTYDKLNRATNETSNGVTHTTTFDKAGNTITQTYGRTDRVLTCTYDVLNRLLTCSERVGEESPRVTTYAYDLNGNIIRKALPNLTYTDKVFDPLNRCTSVTNLRSDASVIHNITSTYDLVGNVTQCVETSASTEVFGGTMTTANSYDKTYRLLTETRTDTGQSGTETKVTAYAYSKANNRTTKTVTIDDEEPQVTTYTYGGEDYNSNQLASYIRPAGGGIVTFTYDANGNRATRKIGPNMDASDTDTADPDTADPDIPEPDIPKMDTYSYDYDNRLVSLDYQTDTDTSKNGIYTYQYDHRTRRVQRDESALPGGDNTLLVFSGGLSVQEHTDAITAAPAVEYIRGSDYGGGVGGVLYTLRGGAPSYNYYNTRGDVLAKTDATGATTWQANYEAFGTRTAENGSTADRQKGNTKDEDPTGLLNEGMRYRDLEAGIFISRDPAGFVDGPNVYTYVRQNPWSAYDPEGLFLGFIADAGFAVYDTVQYSRGKISGKEYSKRMALTGASVLANAASGGTAGLAVRGASMAARAGSATVKVAKAVDKANTAYETASGVAANAEAMAGAMSEGDARGMAKAAVGMALDSAGGKKTNGSLGASSQRKTKAKTDAQVETVAPKKGRENVTKVFKSRKEMKEARPKAKPPKPGQKRVTRQTRNQAGEGNKMKTDGGSQTPHFHDANHSSKTKPNVHYRQTKKYKADTSASTED